MRKEAADYIIIAAQALPAGVIALAVAVALILVTGDAETWGWIPVLTYWVAYLHHAGQRWETITGGGDEHGTIRSSEDRRRTGSEHHSTAA